MYYDLYTSISIIAYATIHDKLAFHDYAIPEMKHGDMKREKKEEDKNYTSKPSRPVCLLVLLFFLTPNLEPHEVKLTRGRNANYIVENQRGYGGKI